MHPTGDHGLIELYPGRSSRALSGLYLGLGLHRAHARASDGIWIWSNFVASIDGRISVPDGRGGQKVPEAVANERDWRLFQELAAQADVLIVSGRYIRQLAQGSAQAPLPPDPGPAFSDLAAFRAEQGLAPLPDVAVLSRSLDLPAPVLAALPGRSIHLLTGADAPGDRVADFRARGVRVHRAPEAEVGGRWVRQRLKSLGYRAAYLIAGPEVHRTFVADGALDELFLTQRHLLIGGGDVRTLISGDLAAPASLRLVHLFFDPVASQSFVRFHLVPGL